jgi:hypothetical protein
MKMNVKDLFICQLLEKGRNLKLSYLDKDRVLWFLIDDKLIGKRSVYTNTYASRWIEDVRDGETIKSYPCGKDADYNETFIKEYETT